MIEALAFAIDYLKPFGMEAVLRMSASFRPFHTQHEMSLSPNTLSCAPLPSPGPSPWALLLSASFPLLLNAAESYLQSPGLPCMSLQVMNLQGIKRWLALCHVRDCWLSHNTS